jgi:hypothetical protein
MLGEIGVNAYFYNYANGDAVFGTNSIERLRITNLGTAIGVAAPILTAGDRGNLTINGSGASILTLASAGTFNMYIYSTSSFNEIYSTPKLWLGTAGSTRISIETNGNVLVGTTTDSGFKLDVNGTGRFTGALSGTSATFSSVTIGSLGSGSDAILNLATNASGSPRAIIYRAATAFIDITNTAGTAVFQLSNGGAATFASSITATSFFESSSVAFKNILATNPITALNVDVIKYKRTNVDVDDVRYGYSAEQINSLMPELTNKEATAVKYLDVHTLLIAELQREIKELKAKLK